MITIRIARLVMEGPRAEAKATLAAFRDELARLAAEGRLPAAGAARTLQAVTPGGRGREAAQRLAPVQPKGENR